MKEDVAERYFKEGYNCAQSVLLAFKDDFGLSKDIALRISSSFGGGMGKLREVCGAVSGMFMVLGLKYGLYDPLDMQAKGELYKMVQEVADKFKIETNSILCKDLLGIDRFGHKPENRTDDYYKKRPCAKLVALATKIVDEYIKEKEAVTLGEIK